MGPPRIIALVHEPRPGAQAQLFHALRSSKNQQSAAKEPPNQKGLKMHITSHTKKNEKSSEVDHYMLHFKPKHSSGSGAYLEHHFAISIFGQIRQIRKRVVFFFFQTPLTIRNHGNGQDSLPS